MIELVATGTTEGPFFGTGALKGIDWAKLAAKLLTGAVDWGRGGILGHGLADWFKFENRSFGGPSSQFFAVQ